jgi:FKBP-type peptidyl-prolyl cis-trans isomerase FkpA
MVKYSFILFAIIGFGLSSCNKSYDCTFTAPVVSVPAAEAKALDAYMKTVGYAAIKSPKGFYYHIFTPGEGATVAPCTTINVFYKGQYTDGTVFDRSGSIVEELPLYNTMYGWQLGLPLIKPGGRILLYLPPSLCFGDQRFNTPKTSILVYEISLVYTF